MVPPGDVAQPIIGVNGERGHKEPFSISRFNKKVITVFVRWPLERAAIDWSTKAKAISWSANQH